MAAIKTINGGQNPTFRRPALQRLLLGALSRQNQLDLVPVSGLCHCVNQHPLRLLPGIAARRKNHILALQLFRAGEILPCKRSVDAVRYHIVMGGLGFLFKQVADKLGGIVHTGTILIEPPVEKAVDQPVDQPGVH